VLFYRAFRAVVALLLQLFYRLEPVSDPHGGLKLEGPVIFVGNHPNGLVDPGMVFAFTQRHVTFLAKAPLFKIPVLGMMLRAMQALPVFRKQDNTGDMTKNESTLTASIEALVKGRAITIFPEGKSHSEPQLAELKTGCARIALEAVRQGAPVKIVPVGLNYLQKDLFRSRARADVGPALDPAVYAPKPGEDPREATRKLTEAIADSLRAVTLNLEKWEDLPLIETAESLYALKVGDRAKDTERLRAFARGMQLLRDEQPERFEKLKSDVLSFQNRLSVVDASARELTYSYRPTTVAWFVLRNLLWLLGLPVVALGMALFAIPYWIPVTVVKLTRPEIDTEATVKVMTLLVLAPVWWAVLTVGAWVWLGWGVGVAMLVGTLPLALFTRVFLERRAGAIRDVRMFLVLGSRKRLKERLVAEGDAIAAQIETVAEELRPRIAG
jgi:glycerol-3-phosphate O-acyltransferase / dihydroxyacetone phosphate acyltransferase